MKKRRAYFSCSQLKEQENKTTQTRWSLHQQVATMEENSETQKSPNEGSPRNDELNFSKPHSENRNKFKETCFWVLSSFHTEQEEEKSSK